ncbi:unnamed protein product [Nippostrongylus brasiliensis]|uniref:Craniofacial development protein 1 n=1 Tax=Nippostrongylus brasiliensis TaxID=27835 RepID=A0A0N4YQS4_NIPBR|nr:unnamed protein product [Nippostrongylus brasiliensis]
MADHESDYHSSDDEDYVPDDGVEDVECSSGDEAEEVNETDAPPTSKRKRGGRDAPVKSAKDISSAEVDAETSAPSSSRDDTPSEESESKEAETKCITEVYDFAGDEVKVQRVVSAEEAKELEAKERRKENDKSKRPQKLVFDYSIFYTDQQRSKYMFDRYLNEIGIILENSAQFDKRFLLIDTLRRLGLGGALTLLAKKSKMSVLDKSNLDWTSYKAENNLQEELETFNRGKNGYLDKMEFLSRTDYNEFEKEKALRNAARKPL